MQLIFVLILSFIIDAFLYNFAYWSFQMFFKLPEISFLQVGLLGYVFHFCMPVHIPKSENTRPVPEVLASNITFVILSGVAYLILKLIA